MAVLAAVMMAAVVADLAAKPTDDVRPKVHASMFRHSAAESKVGESRHWPKVPRVVAAAAAAAAWVKRKDTDKATYCKVTAASRKVNDASTHELN